MQCLFYIHSEDSEPHMLNEQTHTYGELLAIAARTLLLAPVNGSDGGGGGQCG